MIDQRMMQLAAQDACRVAEAVARVDSASLQPLACFLVIGEIGQKSVSYSHNLTKEYLITMLEDILRTEKGK